MIFIAFPDDSLAGSARFFEAMLKHQAKIHRCWSTHGGALCNTLLVECEDRDAFAADCGTKNRPIGTEKSVTAKPQNEKLRELLRDLGDTARPQALEVIEARLRDALGEGGR